MKRGFEQAEYEARVAAAQLAMQQHELAAILLTTEPEVRYFTGFHTRFWESPSRPWFVVLPQSGAPIAVIPSIGEALMRRCWINDIRCWSAPDPLDDGVSLLIGTLREVAQEGKIGVPSGLESQLRMPLADFGRLQAAGLVFGDDAGIVAQLRAIKSEAEIEKIARACAIAGRAFDRLGDVARQGAKLDAVFRGFQGLLLAEGADWVPYLAGGAGPKGYSDVISPAGPQVLAMGDVLMLDTGAVWDGYFCDFDRNFSIGLPARQAARPWSQLQEAALAGFEAAQPGAEAADVWRAMAAVTGKSDTAGRLGHGLGMQLTEGLSLTEKDHTILEPGMVITLEPGVETGDGMMLVHEENIVIREGGAQILSPWASGPMPVL